VQWSNLITKATNLFVLDPSSRHIIDASLVPKDVTNPEDIKGPPLMLHSRIYLTAVKDFVEIVGIINCIKSQVCSDTMFCDVIITGHSLGGGQAQAFGIALKNWLIDNEVINTTLKVFSFASPLMAWSSIDSPDLVRYLQEKNYKRYRVHPNMIKEPNNAVQDYIFNFVNLKDVVPRLPFVVKFRYTLLNAIPNTALAKFLSSNNTNVVVGCKPLGHTYVMQVLTEEKVPFYCIDIRKTIYEMLSVRSNIVTVYEWLFFGAFLFKKTFKDRLILNDFTNDHSWFMMEYNKSAKSNYPLTIGYNNTDNKNGWNVENHTAQYYYNNLKCCWDATSTVLISD